jgi:hypothetical protein
LRYSPERKTAAHDGKAGRSGQHHHHLDPRKMPRTHYNTKRFLLSLHDGTPEFKAIYRPQAADLPAVKWKLLNLRKLMEQNAEKHASQRAALARLFDYTGFTPKPEICHV